MNIQRHIPNSITCLNLACGTLAIIASFTPGTILCGLTGLQCAWILIGLAALFDFMDGAAARLLRAYSDLGKELDSLSDLVSFGVAPATIMINAITVINGSWSSWSLAAVIIPVLGALRLARFNIDNGRQSTSFIGLPIPANALFWVGVSAFILTHGTGPLWGLALVMVLFSSLMVSRMRMFSLKFHNFDWRENFRRYVILLAAVLFVVFEGVAGLAWTVILYILISACGRKDV